MKDVDLVTQLRAERILVLTHQLRFIENLLEYDKVYFAVDMFELWRRRFISKWIIKHSSFIRVRKLGIHRLNSDFVELSVNSGIVDSIVLE